MTIQIKQHISAMGRAELRNKLGVTDKALSAAIAREHFPASWYRVVKSLAKKKGVEISDDLFNWRQPQPKGN